MIEFKVDADSAGMRLDKFLRKKLERVPVSHLFKMIRTKRIRVNARRAYPDQALQAGDAIAVRATEEPLLATAGNGPLHGTFHPRTSKEALPRAGERKDA